MQIQLFATEQDLQELMEKIKAKLPDVQFMNGRGKIIDRYEWMTYATNLTDWVANIPDRKEPAITNHCVEIGSSNVNFNKKRFTAGRIYLLGTVLCGSVLQAQSPKLVMLYKEIVKIVKKESVRWYKYRNLRDNYYALKHADETIFPRHEELCLHVYKEFSKD